MVGENSYYYVHNAHGDVVQRVMQNGDSTPTYQYDAFGNQREINDNDINPFRYCGEYYDKEKNEVYLRTRSYNPEVGRFTSEDIARMDFNWYTYCGNEPIKHHDALGMDYYIFHHEGRVVAAETMATIIEEEYGIPVHLIQVDTPEDFYANWNAMGDTSATIGGIKVETSEIEGVITILHGSQQKIVSGDKIQENIPLNLLTNDRQIGFLILASCKTGKGEGNVAEYFISNSNIGFVVAPTENSSVTTDIGGMRTWTTIKNAKGNVIAKHRGIYRVYTEQATWAPLLNLRYTSIIDMIREANIIAPNAHSNHTSSFDNSELPVLYFPFRDPSLPFLNKTNKKTSFSKRAISGISKQFKK